MAAYKILGNIYQIGAIETFPTKNNSVFKKRTLVLCQRRFDPNTGEEFDPNYPVLEFTGNGCAQLDNFRQGDKVQVSFEVQGTKYPDKQTGEDRFIVHLRGFKCEAFQMPQQQYVQPQPTPQAPPQYAQQPVQPVPTPPQAAAPQPTPPQTDAYGNPINKDGLPF